ncbi:MAG: flagellar biosynthesis protein FlhF [Syntrophobacterales bacterium]|nr:MAG: flagellar biosynthesis protein FlhF [Syntrophobacterales bacterium]
MHIKRYEAANMREAMAKIKKELGPDAVILSTKKISSVGPLIEVMAAREREPVKPVADHPAGPQGVPRQDGGLGGLQQDIRDLKSCIDGLTRQVMFKSDLIDLKEALNMLCDSVSIRNDSHLQNLYLMFIANGFSRIRALRLTETIKNEFPSTAADSLEKAALLAEQVIARSCPKDDYKGKRIKAFIGPSGVGKTTTLAKLAAQYCFEKKMKVGLITTDTYRIAAPEQLKVYAKIMGIPLDVAPDKDKFMQSLTNFADKDVIFVDTPGRSRQDHRCLSTLKSILTDDVETFLLLSPVASREYLIEAADRFRILDYNRIILTKIDECTLLGPLVDVLDIVGKPVSYLTTGQNVPKDIEKANPERLAQLTLQNRLH